ncbi:MAG: LuxR C-terminal-related transcriptional regulator [Thermoflexales bacterium]|nr:LuxR C-terminal-related transcriptional regulator [Thermoflexales bacterium]
MAEAGEALTERELEVVRLVATGATNKEIAAALFVSPNTVKVHLRNIFIKLETESRTAVTLHAVRHGWVTVAQPPGDLTPMPAEADPATPAVVDVDSAPTVLAEPVVLRPPTGIAPNPLPLPPLARLRRIALVGGLAVTLVGSLLALPARDAATASVAGGPLTLKPGAGTAGSALRVPGETTRWFERERLPAGREYAVAAGVNDGVLVFGGVTADEPTGEVLLYSPRTNGWTTLTAQKSTPVGLAAAAAINGIVYVSGGMLAGDTPTDRVEAFETATGAWTRVASLPVALAGHASVALSGTLYVLGGYSAQGASSAVFAYQPGQAAWTRVAGLSSPRGLLAAASLGGSIYALGGQSDGEDRSDCERYDPASDRWTPCARMSVRRSAFGAAAAGGTLYAFGGGGSTYLGFSERYDPARDTWTLFETPKLGDWRNFAVGTLPSGIYVIGGRAGADRLRDTFVYEAGGSRVFIPALTQDRGTP